LQNYEESKYRTRKNSRKGGHHMLPDRLQDSMTRGRFGALWTAYHCKHRCTQKTGIAGFHGSLRPPWHGWTIPLQLPHGMAMHPDIPHRAPSPQLRFANWLPCSSSMRFKMALETMQSSQPSAGIPSGSSRLPRITSDLQKSFPPNAVIYITTC
jgi:hypothetical protein